MYREEITFKAEINKLIDTSTNKKAVLLLAHVVETYTESLKTS